MEMAGAAVDAGLLGFEGGARGGGGRDGMGGGGWEWKGWRMEMGVGVGGVVSGGEGLGRKAG